MDELLIYFYIAILAVLILIALLFLKLQPAKEKEQHEVEETTEERVIRPRRGEGTARARMRMAQAQRQQQDRPTGSDESGDDEDNPASTSGIPTGKVGKKKLAKLQLKAEKKAQREAEQLEREEKKAEEEKQWELRQIQDAKEKAEENAIAEEEKRRKEEEAKKEQDEYEQFKQQFSVQEEGYDEIQDKGQEDNLLKEFIEYVKKSKVVVLEEVAALFKIKTQAVINRIVKLQEDGRITGVIDDRGKFIYISREELEKVAKFIQQRGRVSLTEIAEASNQLINLNSELALEA